MNVQHTYTESMNSSNAQVAADTHIHGRWLMFARVGWFVLVVPALAVFVASLPAYIAQLQSVCNGTACAALHPVGGKWVKSIKLPPAEYAVAGCDGCDSHTPGASRLWCDCSCPPQSHWRGALAENQTRPGFPVANYERPTRLCVVRQAPGV